MPESRTASAEARSADPDIAAPIITTPQHSPAAAIRTAARRYPRVAVFSAMMLALVLLALLAPVIAPYSPTKTHPSQALQSPSREHILGTDQLGRDSLSRVLFGMRVSLQAGVVAVVIGAVIGIGMGLMAGYWGGAVDQGLSRYIDAQLAFPPLLLAIAIGAALGPSLLTAMIAVGITAIPRFMRFTRGQVLSAREYEYVAAAKALGASQWRIAIRHILPNVMDSLVIIASLAAGAAILTEAALSFLGIGAQPPTPELGSMINVARDYLQNQAWLAVGPGMAIFLIVWCFASLGDALREALDPRLRG
jgi:ABC-type dipeptide/oligopeptide/nickel transport system permease subunit